MNWHTVTALLAAIFSLSLGTFVFSRNRSNKLNQSFFMMNIAVCIWNLADVLVATSGNSQRALFFDRISYIGAAFITPFFMQLIFTLVKYNALPRFINIYRVFIALAVTVSLLAVTSRHFISQVSIEPFSEITGPLYALFVVSFFAGTSFAMFTLFNYYRKTNSVYVKKQSKFMIFVFAVGVTAVLNYFLYTVKIPGIPPLQYVVEIVYLSVFAYAIFQHHIMDINMIVKRSSVHAIMIIMTSIIYVTMIYIFESILRGVIGYNTMWARVSFAIIIACTFYPVRIRVENAISKLMFKMDFEYTRSLKNFTDKLVTILDLRELMGTIVENISTTLKVDNVALLTIDKKNRMFSVKASVGFDTTVRGITVREDNPLIVWLKGKVRERKQMAIRTALLEGMYSPETELISCMDLFKAELCIPLFFYEQLIAVITISIKKSGDIYSSEDLNMLKTLSNQASIALSNAFAYDDMRKTYLGTIEALAMAIEAKDQYTRGHSERVVKVAMEIAREMGIPRDQIELLQYAGILHDIGKIAIDDEILKKNTTLTEEEFMAIMEHPAAGESIVAPISFLDGVRTIIRHHHERWDGRGYPDRLAYESIPLLSRILTVADTFDAITSARSYRPARSHDEAVSELQRCAGKQFDPEVVEYFVAAYKKGRIS